MGRELERILFLWYNDSDFYAIHSKKKGISVEQAYRNMSPISKVIRRIQLKFSLPNIVYWVNEWKYKLEYYDVVIIHASILAPPLVKYIRNNNKYIRVIVWYWNPVSKCVHPKVFDELECEIWSFDEKDCRQYEFKYNTQYHFKNIKLDNHYNEYDVFFLGGDKGRAENLFELEDKLKKNGLKVYFHVTSTGKINKKYKKKYKKRISYEENLSIISKSKVILDYVSDNQSGLTLRPLESMFYRKKLISNDKNLVNKDFYKKQNIFILGKDNIKDLNNFINTPYSEISETILNKYDFDNWIDNFFEINNEVKEFLI